jgi:hypothetical protein
VVEKGRERESAREREKIVVVAAAVADEETVSTMGLL